MTLSINLIPKRYVGNPREALGYCWFEIVTDENGDLDREKSTPGIDLSISFDECIADLEKQHGPLVTVSRDRHRVGTRSEVEYKISYDLTPVAFINGMWSGGPSVAVYKLAECTPVVKPTEEQIADEPIHHDFGYCEKCESYCFGDCEASEDK